MAVTYAEIATDIKEIFDALVASGDLKRNYNYDQLPAAFNETPAAETYWQSSSSERVTYKAVVRKYTMTFHTDIAVTQLSNITQDWQQVMVMVDKVEPFLEANDDLDDLRGKVKWVAWTIERVLLEREEKRGYPGLRIVWTIITF